MLKIEAIELQNIKGFSGVFKADFSDAVSLYSISGSNGSGKSTLFRALLLVQKIIFVSQLSGKTQDEIDYIASVKEEFTRTLKAKKSSIKVFFSVNKVKTSVGITAKFDSPDEWEIDDDKGLELVSQFWNAKNPKYVILYLDAGKTVLEEEIRYSNLSIPYYDQASLALRCIFSPQQAFSTMYRQTMQDYIVERLSPSGIPRTLYQTVAQDVFSDLLGTVDIVQFSSRNDQQLTLQAKRRGPRNLRFDVRELSSGEKTLYFTLSYLFLANTVGTLIIDEPENHFHENLLLKFVSFLHDMLNSNDVRSLLEKIVTTALNNDSKKIAERLRRVDKIYNNHKLSQVFLLSHSKTLIYHLFSLGANYTIKYEDQKHHWSKLDHDNVELTLRELGLTTTLDKILFVEGPGDVDLLSRMLAKENVVVRPLSGSNGVKDMFRRLSDVRPLIRGVQFGFLVDNDGKGTEFSEVLRNINHAFFDSSFVFLKRHEVENYFLDEKTFSTALQAEFDAQPNNILKADPMEVRIKLVELAKHSMLSSYQKAVSADVERRVISLLAPKLWGNKALKYDSVENMINEMDQAKIGEIGNEIKDLVENSATQMRSHYFNLDDQQALERCDGKVVLSQAAIYFSKKCGVTKERFQSQVYHFGFAEEGSEATVVLQQLKKIFH